MCVRGLSMGEALHLITLPMETSVNIVLRFLTAVKQKSRKWDSSTFFMNTRSMRSRDWPRSDDVGICSKVGADI